MTNIELSKADRDSIDAMSIGGMHYRWVYAPIGSFQTGDPYAEYFQQVMNRKRAEDPAGWTQASKDNMR